tara:strand:- start:157 stop:612 length:456 start_codon:yes stop_codon:yes gene_type:complete
MIKKIFSLLLILLLTNCGFTPLYNDTNKINYKINIIEINGDRVINNILKSEINRISNPESKEVFNLKINTFYEKIILSKNAKGTASDYQLIAKTNFIIQDLDKTQVLSFEEKQNIKNILDIFEQKNYENSIKEIFASSMIRKLNLELINKK